jgi:hypothetical protein
MTLVEFRTKGLIEEKTIIVASLAGGLPVMMYVTAFFLVPVLFVVFVFAHSGIMAFFTKMVKPLSSWIGLPAESAQVTAAAVVNLVAAMGIGSKLSKNGLLTGGQVVLALLCGLFIFNMMELFHTTLPYNVSFFGPRLGIKVAFTTFLAIGVSEAIVIMLLLLSTAGSCRVFLDA